MFRRKKRFLILSMVYLIIVLPNNLPLKFEDYFNFVFIEFIFLLASQSVRGKHFTIWKSSLKMVTLKAIRSSLRIIFQRLMLLRGRSPVVN